MPDFVKSGDRYYKINQKTGQKKRISEDEYKKSKVNKTSKKISRNTLTTKRKATTSRKITRKPEVIKRNNVNTPNVMKTLTNVKNNSNNKNSLDSVIEKIVSNEVKKYPNNDYFQFTKKLIIKNREYDLYAEVGKHPNNYYGYNITLSHLSNNGSYQSVYQKSLISSKPIF